MSIAPLLRSFALPLLVLASCAGDRPPAPTSSLSSTPAVVDGVGERTETFADSARDREIETTIWYPTSDGGVAAGRHPIVLFSHGLGGEPEGYEELFEPLVRGGFVVVAPRYPNTNASVASLQARDLVNQPADASFVLDEITEIASDSDDELSGALDLERVAAVGHSLGGMTTVGMMSDCCTDPRLDAAVIYAGSGLGFERDELTEDPPPVLFIHGDADSTVPIRGARSVYGKLEGAKAFVTLRGAGHVLPFVARSDPHFDLVRDATLTFLGWLLLDTEDGLDHFRKVAGGSDLVALEDELPRDRRSIMPRTTRPSWFLLVVVLDRSGGPVVGDGGA